MQVHCTEGVASHSGPESCARIREGAGEALTGERAGQPLSRDSGVVPSADAFQIVEGNIARPLMQGHGGLGAVEDPGMCGRSLYGNREILGLAGEAPPVRTGKARSRSR